MQIAKLASSWDREHLSIFYMYYVSTREALTIISITDNNNRPSPIVPSWSMEDDRSIAQENTTLALMVC